jgi:hypothetical protein
MSCSLRKARKKSRRENVQKPSFLMQEEEMLQLPEQASVDEKPVENLSRQSEKSRVSKMKSWGDFC